MNLPSMFYEGNGDGKRLIRYSKRFSLLAPVGNAVFGPLLLNREYKQKGRPDAERRMLVFQEAASQGVNLAVHFASFLGLMKLTEKFLKRRGVTGTALEAALVLSGNFGSFLGMSFLRPVVSAKLLNKWAARKKAPAPQPAHAQSAHGFETPDPMQAQPPLQRTIAPPSHGFSVRLGHTSAGSLSSGLSG